MIRNLDKPLFLSALALAGAGFLAIYSATRGTGSEWSFASYAVRQLLWIGLGILSAILVLRVDYFKFQDWARGGISSKFLNKFAKCWAAIPD